MSTTVHRCSSCRYRAARYRVSHYGFSLPFCSESCSELFHDLVAPIGPRMQGKRPAPEAEEDDAVHKLREKMRKLSEEMELALQEMNETAGREAAEAERVRARERLTDIHMDSDDDDDAHHPSSQEEKAQPMEVEPASHPHADQPGHLDEEPFPLPRILRESDLNYWQALPVELRVAILADMPIMELLRYSRVSREFQYFINNNDDLWRNWLRRPAVAAFYDRIDVPTSPSQPRMRTWHDEAMVYLASCDYVVREPDTGKLLRMAMTTLRPGATVAEVRVSGLFLHADGPFPDPFKTREHLVNDDNVGLRIRNARETLIRATSFARVYVLGSVGHSTAVDATFLLEREAGTKGDYVGRLLRPDDPRQPKGDQLKKTLQILVKRSYLDERNGAWGIVRNLKDIFDDQFDYAAGAEAWRFELSRISSIYSMAVLVTVDPPLPGITGNGQAALTHVPCLEVRAPRTCRPLGLISINWGQGTPVADLYRHFTPSTTLRQHLEQQCDGEVLRAARPVRVIFRAYLMSLDDIPEVSRQHEIWLREYHKNREDEPHFIEAGRRARRHTRPILTITVSDEVAAERLDKLQLSLRTLVVNLHPNSQGIWKIDRASISLLYDEEHPGYSAYEALRDVLDDGGEHGAVPSVLAVRSGAIMSHVRKGLSLAYKDPKEILQLQRDEKSEYDMSPRASEDIHAYVNAWRAVTPGFDMEGTGGAAWFPDHTHWGFVALYPSQNGAALQPTAFIPSRYLGGTENMMLFGDGRSGFLAPPHSGQIDRGGPLGIARSIGNGSSRSGAMSAK